MTNITLLGRVLLTGEIEAKTGLHIGGSPGALAIGNVDLPVIRDARTNQPYIPGSSLKGKMRSLSEKLTGAPQNTTINKGKADGSGKVQLHTAQNAEEYARYWVNPLFGIMSDAADWLTAPGRLVVRDVQLSAASRDELLNAHTDQPFTEVKWEAAIDRVTSAATPRQIERVPAGAVFAPMELVVSLYKREDAALLEHLITALQLVEDDYIGGQGSRGSGKIAFRGLSVSARLGDKYTTQTDAQFSGLTLADLASKKASLRAWVEGQLR